MQLSYSYVYGYGLYPPFIHLVSLLNVYITLIMLSKTRRPRAPSLYSVLYTLYKDCQCSMSPPRTSGAYQPQRTLPPIQIPSLSFFTPQKRRPPPFFLGYLTILYIVYILHLVTSQEATGGEERDREVGFIRTNNIYILVRLPKKQISSNTLSILSGIPDAASLFLTSCDYYTHSPCPLTIQEKLL